MHACAYAHRRSRAQGKSCLLRKSSFCIEFSEQQDGANTGLQILSNHRQKRRQERSRRRRWYRLDSRRWWNWKNGRGMEVLPGWQSRCWRLLDGCRAATTAGQLLLVQLLELYVLLQYNIHLQQQQQQGPPNMSKNSKFFPLCETRIFFSVFFSVYFVQN